MKNELMQERNRYAIVGIVMIIISVLFLYYIGSSLVCSTKKYINEIHTGVLYMKWYFRFEFEEDKKGKWIN